MRGFRSLAEDGIVQSATREIKKRFPISSSSPIRVCASTWTMGIAASSLMGVCLTILASRFLARAAVSQAEAGADIIAPSDMMDGRVAAIRAALDQAGFEHTPIMAYSAKFASGTLRTVSRSGRIGATIRRSHQLSNGSAQWARSFARDRAGHPEGADIVMVKPALTYLDLISKAQGNDQTANRGI